MAKHQIKILYMAELDYETIKDDLTERNIKYQIADQYPHCYGEMNWILKYPVWQEKDICSCRYSHNCYKLTRGIENMASKER